MRGRRWIDSIPELSVVSDVASAILTRTHKVEPPPLTVNCVKSISERVASCMDGGDVGGRKEDVRCRLDSFAAYYKRT
jgi:hypothetical protein